MIRFLVALAVVPFAASQASVCLDLNSTQHIKDMKIDALGQIFYIDIANEVFALRPNCGERSLIYNVDVPLPNGLKISMPTSLEFGSDLLGRQGLYIANGINSEGILFFLEFDFVNFAILDAVPVPIVATFISELKLAPNGDLFAVDMQQAILRFNILTGETTTFLSFGSGIVDIFDIVTSQTCPYLYISANDNDEVWFCKDLANGESCVPLTGSLLHSPWGVEIDCKCQVYVTNDGNGNMRLFNPEVHARPTLQCAYEAERLIAGGYLNNDGAVDSDVSGAKVSYRFPRAGTLWLYTRCLGGGQWLVNGDLFTIAASQDFEWRQFGTPQSITNIFPIVQIESVTPGCEIAKVFMGEDADGARLPSGLLDKECASAYVCASEFCLHGEAEIVDVPNQGPALNSPCSQGDAGCASTAARIVFEEAIFTSGATTLYLETLCSSATSNSWFVNGRLVEFALTGDFVWQNAGVVSGPIVTLTPAESGCRIRGAFLGHPSGTQSQPELPYPCTCCLKDTTVFYTMFGDIFAQTIDASQLRCTENFELTAFRDVRMTNIAIQQSCTFQPTPPSTASPSPSTSPVGVITCGSTVNGDTSSAQHPFVVGTFQGPNQGYRFTIAARTHVVFDTCSNLAYDTIIAVIDSTGTVVNSDDDSCSLGSNLDVTLDAGSYTVVVGGFFSSSSGPYTLIATCTSESASQTPSSSSSVTSTGTSTTSSTQTPSSSTTQTPSSSRTQTSSATQTPSTSTTQTPSQTATASRTQTSSPSQTPSQSATQTSSQTPTQTSTQSPTQTPSQSSTQSSTQTPSRSVTQTSSSTVTPSPSSTAVGAIVCGQTVVGSVSGSNQAFPLTIGNGANVAFRLDVAAATVIQLSTCVGTNFDSVLAVFDGSSVQLSIDDDGCSSPQSFISSTLTPGTYFVVVGAKSTAVSGSFQLSLNCPSASSTPTSTSTQTPSQSSTQTPSSSRSQTPSSSQTQTPSSSATQSPTQTPTQTSSQTPTQTATQSPTQTPSQSATQTPSSSQTQTPSSTRTQTPSSSVTQTPSSTATQTPTQSATQTPSQSSTQTPTQSASQTPSQSTTQTPSQSASRSASNTATSSVSPSATPSSSNVVTFSLNTIFAVGHDTGGASQGNQQAGSRTFTSGRGIAMAITLLRAVGTATPRFVRFVGTDTLQTLSSGAYPILQRFRLFSSVALLRLARCPVQTPIQSLSTFLKTRILSFINTIPDAPTSLDAELRNALLLDDVADVECIPPTLTLGACDPEGLGTPTLCPTPLRSRYTMGLVWGAAEQPFTTENGVNVFMQPFNSATNPTFTGLAAFTSHVVDPSSGTLRTGVILNSQVQVVRTLFPECSTQKTVAAGSCNSVAATSEVGQGKAQKSQGFCFTPPSGLQNSCKSTSPSGFGCFCDECCYIFGDCCPDVEFCDAVAGALDNECHDPITDAVNPALDACVALCGTVTPL